MNKVEVEIWHQIDDYDKDGGYLVFRSTEASQTQNIDQTIQHNLMTTFITI